MSNIKTKKNPRNIISWANKVPQYKESSSSRASNTNASNRSSKHKVCSEFESGGKYYDYFLKKKMVKMNYISIN